MTTEELASWCERSLSAIRPGTALHVRYVEITKRLRELETNNRNLRGDCKNYRSRIAVLESQIEFFLAKAN